MSAAGTTYRVKDSVWERPGVVDELRRLCGQKMSTALMADALYVKFRHPFTKNAVISQMRKLKISNGIRSWRIRKLGPKPQSVSQQHQRLGSPYFGKRTSIVPAKPAKASVIDPATNVPLLDHRDGMCRWPVDEVSRMPPFLTYCGGRVAEHDGQTNVPKDCPYCRLHWWMSRQRYQPAEAA